MGRRFFDWERAYEEDQRTLLAQKEGSHARGHVGKSQLFKARWLEAMRWQRATAEICKSVGLTFGQWQVLDALRELDEETNDAVSQSQISVRAEIARSGASMIIRALEDKELLSRGCSASGGTLRVILTPKAIRLLHNLFPRLEAVTVPDCPKVRFPDPDDDGFPRSQR